MKWWYVGLVWWLLQGNRVWAEKSVASKLDTFMVCTPLKIEKQKKSLAKFKYIAAGAQIKPSSCLTDLSEWDPIHIKIRGNSSSHFAKKQYLLEFVDKDQKPQATALLNLPKSEEWVMHAPYIDRSNLRNALAFTIGHKLSEKRPNTWFAPHFRFVELYLNDRFDGLYVLIEKIGKGESKVQLPKFSTTNAVHPFIMEISSSSGDFVSANKTDISYVYPSPSDLKKHSDKNHELAKFMETQLQAQVNEGERRLLRGDEKELSQYFDLDTFVDYFLVQEATKNVDGFRRSMYFTQNEKGVWSMGPLWDFNLAFGNLRFYGMHHTHRWSYQIPHAIFAQSFWFQSLLKHTWFKRRVQERFRQLRQPGEAFSESFIKDSIHQLSFSLVDAAERDDQRWTGEQNMMGKNILRTKDTGHNFQEHVDILQTWLLERLRWLEKNLDKV